MDKDYYFTDVEWARTVGYGSVPPERPVSNINEQHWNGEQQLNKVTGEVEVWYNGMWTVR
jgi:hypothetical protein